MGGCRVSALFLSILLDGAAAGLVAFFFLVCLIPVKHCPDGRYACPFCTRLGTPAGEKAAREYLAWAETAPTVSREQS